MIKTKLNIGCGKDIKKGYINLDRFPLEGIDVVWDLNKFPYPLKANTFSEILAYSILEHLDDLCKVMDELYRISKNKAIIKILVPFFPSMYSVQDPTHKRFFTITTFDYFTGEGKLNYYSKARFKIIKKEIRFSWKKWLKFIDYILNISPKLYARVFQNIIPANELYFELEAVK